jgi:heme exporter protein A
MPSTTIYSAPPKSPLVPIPGVATHDVARLFGQSAALAGVSLSVEKGRLVTLVGPNGAGKTTLLRILATSLRPTFGAALVDGIDVVQRPDLVRQRVAFLAHATGLYEDLTAAENLDFAATMLGRMEAVDRADAVRSALAAVDLAVDADRRVRGFSAGMRRRLALARMLLTEPSLVLLDEPHAALDADGMTLVDGLLDRWRNAGATVMVASHHADRIMDMADGWARLEGGLLAETGGSGIGALAPPLVARPEPATVAVDR